MVLFPGREGVAQRAQRGVVWYGGRDVEDMTWRSRGNAVWVSLYTGKIIRSASGSLTCNLISLLPLDQ